MLNKLIYNLLPTSKYTCFIIPSLLTSNQCESILKNYVQDGFKKAIHNYPTYYRNNERVVVDSNQLAESLFGRIRQHVPEVLNFEGGNEKQNGVWRLKTLNERIRFCRYGPNQYFNRHLDGIHHRSSHLQSKLTFMIYLNSAVGNFTGGRTLFYKNMTTKQILAEYTPKQGDLIIFDHNIWHEGEGLETGEKFVMRSDIIYEKVQENGKNNQGIQTNQPFKQGHQGYIWTLLPWDQNTILSGGRDKSIKIWNSQGKFLGKLQNHENSVLDLIKLNQSTMISCSRDKSIAIWKYINGSFQFVRKWIAHEGSTVLNLLKIDEIRFASGGADSKIRIFSVQEEKQIRVLSGHQDWVWKLEKISDDIIVSCSEDGTVRLWNWKMGKQIYKIKNSCSVQTLAYNKNIKQLYIGDLAGNLSCIDLENKTISWTIKAHEALIRSLHIISDTLIGTCSEDCWVKIWDTTNKKQVYGYEHTNFAQDLCVIKDKLITASYDGKIRQYQLKKIGTTYDSK